MDPQMHEEPNTLWAPSPLLHQEWPAFGHDLPSPSVILDTQPPAGLMCNLLDLSAVPSLQSYPSLAPPAQSPTKNILALVTAADNSNAPVLEFRLQSDDEALMACHRVQAFVFNQAVSSQQHLFADSSMCCGRAHLFDLEVLNLAYYGSSLWTVTRVGDLPPGGVSMALLDSLGKCERCDANNTASSRPNANPLPLGTVIVEAAVAHGALAWTRLRWQRDEMKPVVKPVVVKPVAKLGAKLESASERAVLGPVHEVANTNSERMDFDAAVAGMFIPLAPAKVRKGSPNRRTKLSRRLSVTLHFLADRENAPRTKQKPAALFKAPVFTFKTSGGSGAASRRLSEVVESLSESGSDELEECHAESVQSVMNLLLMDGQDDDAFDLADCLATNIMNHERELEVTEQEALADEAERSKVLEMMWATG